MKANTQYAIGSMQSLKTSQQSTVGSTHSTVGKQNLQSAVHSRHNEGSFHSLSSGRGEGEGKRRTGGKLIPFEHKITKNTMPLMLKIFSGIVLLSGTDIFAQTAVKPDFPDSYYNVLAIGLLTIIVAIVMGFFIFGMGEGKEKPKVVKESAFAKIKQRLTASVPVERESEIDLGHDFDGIKELDNRVPPWFSYLFYITILFAVIYMFDYHVFSSDKLQYDEYAQEMKVAADQRAALEKTGAFVNEETVVALTDAPSVQNGQKIYEANCVACHAAGGAGLVGPNLTDDYWIHGGGIQNVFKTIKYGVPAKGMISWQTQLNPKQIQEVSSYILTIHGTNPPNAKQPEGEKYVPIDSLKTASL